MNETDREWEKWGRQDPYFGVITCDRFRAGRLDEAARLEFFASGQTHVAGVMSRCRELFGAAFAPRRVLDFGCGVGRLVIPFAAFAEEVVGVDVSTAMLAEAGRNCAERGLRNVVLRRSDDALSDVDGLFDLVHSAIVFQHIETARGCHLFARLLDHLQPGGVAAIQITYGKAIHPHTYGQPPAGPANAALAPAARTVARLWRQTVGQVAETAPAERGADDGSVADDPVMLMNPYNLSEIAFVIHAAGARGFQADFTDHGGELGVFLFFQKPPAP